MNIVRVSEADAKDFMKKYEAMGNIGLGRWHYGLIHESELISVVSYGIPCFSLYKTFIGDIAKTFNCKVIQLCRGGTNAKNNCQKNVPSKLIAEANRLLYKDIGNLLIVAYADPEFGEIGAIYQAANAIYLGKTDPKDQSNYVIENVWLSGWDVRKIYGTRKMELLREIDPNVKKYPLHPKYKYLFTKVSKVIKKKILRILEKYRCPYPKKSTERIREF